ncbi:MAG: hypothetical protein Q8W46_00075 [Candidatus Palauibacterales bacterium]|nr:hypothetical protein [Candidatus Palauibacterales bacterium]
MTSGEHEARDMMGLDPWGLRRIEKLLLNLDGVGSLKIVPDGHGGIEEIHVLSSSPLGPKQIVRNIESALLAEFGLQIDHRKISIARVRAPEIEAAAPPETPHTKADTAPAPARTGDRRLVLGNVRIERAAGQKVTCRVDLSHDDTVFTGEAEGPDFEKARMEVAATAALEAAQQAGGDSLSLALQGIESVGAFGHSFVLASVNGTVKRESASLAGVVRVRDSVEEAAVLACLQAVNRWIGCR